VDVSPQCSCTAARLQLIGKMWFLWVFRNNIEDSNGAPRFVLFDLRAVWWPRVADGWSIPATVSDDRRP